MCGGGVRRNAACKAPSGTAVFLSDMAPKKRKITDEKTSEKAAAQAALSAAETAKLPIIKDEDVAAAVRAETVADGDSPAPDAAPEKPKRRLRTAKGTARVAANAVETKGGAPEPSDAADAMPVGAAGVADEGSPSEGEGSADDSAAAASSESSARRKPSVRAAGKGARVARVASVVVGVIACAVVVCFAVFAWNRWLRFDDAADIADAWVVADTGASITIDGSIIDLGPDAKLSYEIDPFAKTITFDLGDMAGEARYRFSDDRSQIAFADGGDSWFATLSDDLAHTLSSLFAQVTGGEAVPLFENPSAVVLTRAGAATAEGEAADADGADAADAPAEGVASADAAAQQAEA